MTDPREDKLPKWAQELLVKERVRAALSWPTVPKPKPDFEIDANGFGVGTPSLREATVDVVYQHLQRAYSDPTVRPQYIKNGYLHDTPDRKGFGSRGSGNYYIREKDAWSALWWHEAEMAARRLYEARKGFEA